MSASQQLAAHGGEATALAAQLGCHPDDFLDFSSNTNIFAAALTKSIASNINIALDKYPDPQRRNLHNAIAEYEGVDTKHVLSTNGSAELIRLIFFALKPKSVLFIGPMFNEYAATCNALGIKYTCHTPPATNGFRCQKKDLNQLHKIKADLTVLCSPNNPGGVVYNNLDEIIESINSKHLVFDASYKDFLYGSNDFTTYQKCLHNSLQQPRVIFINSLTKFFACPGLRLGYAIAHHKLIEVLAPIQPAWPIGAHAEAIGQALLESAHLYRQTLHELQSAKQYMSTRLYECKLFDLIIPGVSFFCVHINSNKIKHETLRQELLKQNIIVRNCDNITGMPTGFIRLQTRTKVDVETLIEKIKKFIK